MKVFVFQYLDEIGKPTEETNITQLVTVTLRFYHNIQICQFYTSFFLDLLTQTLKNENLLQSDSFVYFLIQGKMKVVQLCHRCDKKISLIKPTSLNMT